MNYKVVVFFVVFVTIGVVGVVFSSTNGTMVTGGAAQEILSSRSALDVDQLQVFEDRVIITVENATISKFANTNSMDPTLDEGAHGIEVKPVKEDLQQGDIVSYYSNEFEEYIIHRIVFIGEDKNGTYYTLKGDNNDVEDPERVRFEQIEGVLVGILY